MLHTAGAARNWTPRRRLSRERCAITGSRSAPSGRNRLGHCAVPPRRPLGQWGGNTTAGGRKRRRDSGTQGGPNYDGEGRQATVVAREHRHDREIRTHEGRGMRDERRSLPPRTPERKTWEKHRKPRPVRERPRVALRKQSATEDVRRRSPCG